MGDRIYHCCAAGLIFLGGLPLALVNALCEAAASPKSSTWEVALTTPPGGFLKATTVAYAMGNLARDLISLLTFLLNAVL